MGTFCEMYILKRNKVGEFMKKVLYLLLLCLGLITVPSGAKNQELEQPILIHDEALNHAPPREPGAALRTALRARAARRTPAPFDLLLNGVAVLRNGFERIYDKVFITVVLTSLVAQFYLRGLWCRGE